MSAAIFEPIFQFEFSFSSFFIHPEKPDPLGPDFYCSTPVQTWLPPVHILDNFTVQLLNTLTVG